jgi:hypothetical protein
MNEFEYDVFLSHASADKPAVRELAERLKGDGLRVWLDEWVIQPGDSIPLAIEKGLESSRTLVLVMSQAAFDSDWVTLERHTALFRDPVNRQRRFIPLRLDDCVLSETLKQFACIDWSQRDASQYQRMLASLTRRSTESRSNSTRAATGEGTQYLLSRQLAIQNIALSSNEDVAIVCDEDGNLHVLDLEYGDLRGTIHVHTSGLKSVDVSPDGTRALSIGNWESNRIRVWDVTAAEIHRIATVTCPRYGLGGATYSADGRWIIAWEGANRYFIDAQSFDVVSVTDGRPTPNDPKLFEVRAVARQGKGAWAHARNVALQSAETELWLI